MTTSSPLDVVVEVRIELRDSVLDVWISSTPNLNPVPTDLYTPFILTGTAPASADTARLVYDIQLFDGGPSHTGTVFVDDISFEAVREAASLIPLCVGGLAVMALRRRRS